MLSYKVKYDRDLPSFIFSSHSRTTNNSDYLLSPSNKTMTVLRATLLPTTYNRIIPSIAFLKQSAFEISRTLNNGSATATSSARLAFVCPQHQQTAPSRRQFSTSKTVSIKEFFPTPDAPNIKKTEAAWAHPVYTYEQMEAVRMAHRQARNWSDRMAIGMMRVFRWGMDTATWYRHDHTQPNDQPLDGKKVRPKSAMTERKWLIRYVPIALSIPRRN